MSIEEVKPMTLREVMEALWRDPIVRCPKHITWWNSEVGKLAGGQWMDTPLFYAKGRRVDLNLPDKGIER